MDEIVTAFLASRVEYWRQWSIAADYAPEDRAKLARIVKRHMKNPVLMAAKVENVAIRVEKPWREQNGRALMEIVTQIDSLCERIRRAV